MRLVHLDIERFRGVRRMEMDFDPITVVIGENNHGKSSLLDVLGLCLARRDISSVARFREDDFYRGGSDDSPGDIRILLTFESGESGLESPFTQALTPDRDGARRLRIEYFGTSDDRRVHRRLVDEERVPLDPQPDPSLLEQLQDLHPLLLLRLARPPQEQSPGPAGTGGHAGAERRGPRNLEALIAKVFHDLTHTRGPLPAEEISSGLQAAQRLFGRGLADESADAPMHRMLNEILSDSLDWGGKKGEAGFKVTVGGGTHTVGLLLVLGALLDVRGEGSLPAAASPIIAIEEPAAHLHPILLASTWDVVEALKAQTIVTTNSGELLSSVPMKSLRRLVRGNRKIDVHQLAEDSLTEADARRISYHIRAKRGGVLFARCWLLVEGESEFWLMTQLAHVMGWDLEAEGVRCLEFAQCGVAPLVKLANDLGIEWHVLADGDESGALYARDATRYLASRSAERRVSQLAAQNVERCLWDHGFDDVFREAARVPDHLSRGRVIAKAVRKKSKPYLALAVAEACAARGPDSIPPVLRRVIEISVSLARTSVAGTDGGHN